MQAAVVVIGICLVKSLIYPKVQEAKVNHPQKFPTCLGCSTPSISSNTAQQSDKFLLPRLPSK